MTSWARRVGLEQLTHAVVQALKTACNGPEPSPRELEARELFRRFVYQQMSMPSSLLPYARGSLAVLCEESCRAAQLPRYGWLPSLYHRSSDMQFEELDIGWSAKFTAPDLSCSWQGPAGLDVQQAWWLVCQFLAPSSNICAAQQAGATLSSQPMYYRADRAMASCVALSSCSRSLRSTVLELKSVRDYMSPQPWWHDRIMRPSRNVPYLRSAMPTLMTETDPATDRILIAMEGVLNTDPNHTRSWREDYVPTRYRVRVHCMVNRGNRVLTYFNNLQRAGIQHKAAAMWQVLREHSHYGMAPLEPLRRLASLPWMPRSTSFWLSSEHRTLQDLTDVRLSLTQMMDLGPMVMEVSRFLGTLASIAATAVQQECMAPFGFPHMAATLTVTISCRFETPELNCNGGSWWPTIQDLSRPETQKWQLSSAPGVHVTMPPRQ